MKIQSSTWHNHLKHSSSYRSTFRKKTTQIGFNIGLSYFKETFFFFVKIKSLKLWQSSFLCLSAGIFWVAGTKLRSVGLCACSH